MRPAILTASLMAVALTAPAQGQTGAAPAQLNGLSRCQATQDSGARLACYDQEATRLLGAASSGQIAIVDREQAQKARRSLFGFSVPDFPFFAKTGPKQPEFKELTSTVTSFRSTGNNFYRFAIADNGAVWETTEAATMRDARVGETVRISRGALGSFWAKLGAQREVRVRRVR